MAGAQNINFDPVIPSLYELMQTHISTDRKTFMLAIEQKLKELVSDYADTTKQSITIDDKFFEDKFSAGTTLFLNRHITSLETAQTTFNSVYQTMIKFEKDVQGLLG